MNPQRSPPSRYLTGTGVSSAANTGHSSHPDLTQLSALAAESQITFRKRKQPSDNNCECSNEIKEMRSELSRIGSLLEKYVGSSEQIMNKMQENITEIKSQMSELKSSNEQTVHLIRENTTQINEIKSSTSNIEMKQKSLNLTVSQLEKQIFQGEQKIISLESDLNNLKLSTVQPSASKSDNQSSSNEQVIKEIMDRNNREKNIVLAGLSEQTSTTAEERISGDERDILNVTSQVCQNPPKPIKIFRIGKYVPGKHRRVKVCFDTAITAKYFLRNKDKLPENVKIFSDQTPAQQQYLKSLKEELARRQNDGENELTIKYIHGTPTIVKNPPKNYN